MSDYVNTAELAGILELQDRQVRRLVERGVITADKDGSGHYRYDPVQAQEEYAAHLGELEGSLTSIREQIDEAESRIKRATADIKELELAEMRGEYHREEFVEEFVLDYIFAERAAVMALPGKLAPTLANKSDVSEVEEIIRREIDTILDDLKQYEYRPEYFAERLAAETGQEIETEQQRA